MFHQRAGTGTRPLRQPLGSTGVQESLDNYLLIEIAYGGRLDR